MPLTVEGVTHRYTPGSRPVLDGVSLVIHQGESVAIIGPSGSGKTTLLAILGLLLRPSEGHLFVDGEPAPRGGAALARLRAGKYGWVFQTVNVLARRTVLENASLGLLARGATLHEARDEAQRALRAVGLGGKEDRPAHTLSGGELQRACIARAVAMRPRFLLADEPTGQLDRTTTDEVLDALVRSRPPETALVIVTHDHRVAEQCDRIIAIEDGRLVPERGAIA